VGSIGKIQVALAFWQELFWYVTNVLPILV
jgi:hypothetical protein